MPRERQSKASPGDQPAGRILQLKISLIDIVPPIWRRLLVPGAIRLSDTFRPSSDYTGRLRLDELPHASVRDRWPALFSAGGIR
jgi:hypothetical protein